MFHKCLYFGKWLIIIGLFAEIRGQSNKKFRCNNGKFIDSAYFCDYDNDCGDRSDENFGCTPGRRGCGKARFACTDGDCVPISKRCDTINDCLDGSDELNCGHELSVKNCSMTGEEFLCDDGLRCLRWNETCNGAANCFDGSDENENCFEYDVDICHHCPHPCFRTPKGPRCYYNFSNNTFRSEYEGIEECNMYTNTCNQKCALYRNATQCSCGEHYRLARDSVCLSNVSYGEVVLYSNTEDISLLNVTTEKYFVVQNDVVVTALTAAHDYAYWSVMSNNRASIFKKPIISDPGNESIFSTGAEIIGSLPNPQAEEVISRDLNITSPVTSIAVDWMTKNVYFTSLNWLSVCSGNGRLCTHLKNSTFGIEFVALAPKYGFMFWAQNTESKYFKAYIFISAMDGSYEHVLVYERLRFCNALVVDEFSERLYWLDTELARIESIQFDGKGRKIERSDARNYFSFGEFERKLYWTLEFNNTILYDKSSYKNILIRRDVTVKHLYVYNPLLQRTKISNPCSSSPCKGLCLTQPSLTKKLDYTCVCEHSQPIIDISRSRWCDNVQETSSGNEVEKHRETTNTASRSSTTMKESPVTRNPPVKPSSRSTTTVKQSSTIKNPSVHFDQTASNRLHSSDAEVSTSNGVAVGLFVVISVIALLGVGSYFSFKKWNESRNGDNVTLMFNRKEENNDDL